MNLQLKLGPHPSKTRDKILGVDVETLPHMHGVYYNDPRNPHVEYECVGYVAKKAGSHVSILPPWSKSAAFVAAVKAFVEQELGDGRAAIAHGGISDEEKSPIVIPGEDE